MYMDMDSILFEAEEELRKAEQWCCSAEESERLREEMYLLYGCWADDAARSGLLGHVRDIDRQTVHAA